MSADPYHGTDTRDVEHLTPAAPGVPPALAIVPPSPPLADTPRAVGDMLGLGLTVAAVTAAIVAGVVLRQLHLSVVTVAGVGLAAYVLVALVVVAVQDR